MVHAAVGYARTRTACRPSPCTASIGPGSTNMVTGAALATINRIPVLLLPVGRVRQPGRPTPSCSSSRTPAAPTSPSTTPSGRSRGTSTGSGGPNSCSPRRLGGDARAHRPGRDRRRHALPPAGRAGRGVRLAGRVLRATACGTSPARCRSPPRWRAPSRSSAPRSGRSSSPAAASSTPGRARRCAPSPTATGIPVADTHAGKGAIDWDHPLRRRGRRLDRHVRRQRARARDADVVIGIGTRYSRLHHGEPHRLRRPRRRGSSTSTSPRFDAAKHSARDARRRRPRGAHRAHRGPRRVRHGRGVPGRGHAAAWPTGRRSPTRATTWGTARCPPRPRSSGALNELMGDERRRHQRRRLDARRPAAAVAGPDAVAVPPRVRLLLHGLRDPGGDGRQAGRARRARSSRSSATAPTRCCRRRSSTIVSEGIKVIVVLVQNHGFASIGALSESRGSQRFGTRYRYRNPETGLLDGGDVPLDLAANAESFGVDVLRRHERRRLPGGLQQAVASDRATLIHVETDLLRAEPARLELVGRAGERGLHPAQHPVARAPSTTRPAQPSGTTCDRPRPHRLDPTAQSAAQSAPPTPHRPDPHEEVQSDHHWINGKPVESSGERTRPSSTPRRAPRSRASRWPPPPTSTPPSRRPPPAFETWSDSRSASAPRVLFAFRELLAAHTDELAPHRVSRARQGRSPTPRGEVSRGLEVVEFACGIPQLLKGEYSDQVVHRRRRVLASGSRSGVSRASRRSTSRSWCRCGCTPWPSPRGNTFVLKPSERDPSASIFVAELYARGRAARRRVQRRARRQGRRGRDARPPGRRGRLLRRLHADRAVHPRSTATAARQAGAGARRREEPRASSCPTPTSTYAADHLTAAAFGSAGERCMAISVAVAVGRRRPTRWSRSSRAKARAVKVGARRPTPGAEMGPVITAAAQERIEALSAPARADGADLVVDGRGLTVAGLRGRLLRRPDRDRQASHRTWTSTARSLRARCSSCVRVDRLDEAIDLINAQPVRQRHRHLHRLAARPRARSSAGSTSGMIGVNVPIPVPMAYYSFGGWKDSLFGDEPHPRPRGRPLLHPRQGRHAALAAPTPADGGVYHFRVTPEVVDSVVDRFDLS